MRTPLRRYRVQSFYVRSQLSDDKAEFCVDFKIINPMSILFYSILFLMCHDKLCFFELMDVLMSYYDMICILCVIIYCFVMLCIDVCRFVLFYVLLVCVVICIVVFEFIDVTSYCYVILYVILRWVALFCAVMYCVVIYCNMLCYIVLYFIILYYIILYCIAFYYIILYYIVLYCIV